MCLEPGRCRPESRRIARKADLAILTNFFNAQHLWQPGLARSGLTEEGLAYQGFRVRLPSLSRNRRRRTNDGRMLDRCTICVTDLMSVSYVPGQAGFSVTKICNMLQNLARYMTPAEYGKQPSEPPCGPLETGDQLHGDR
jgi:hypothetical protein